MYKELLVRLYEANNPGLSLKKYVIEVLGYKCCENWDRDELVDEFGYGYCIFLAEQKPASVG